jgi:hypothetical protein
MAARNHLPREKSTPRLPPILYIHNTDLFNSGTLPTTGDMDSSHSPDIPCSLTSASVWNCLGRLGGSALLAKNDTRLKSWHGIIAPNVKGDGAEMVVDGTGNIAYRHVWNDYSNACWFTINRRQSRSEI